MTNKIKKNKFIIKKDTKNRAIALTFFTIINITAIFSDSIIAQFKDYVIFVEKTPKIQKTESPKSSEIQEIIKLQEKYERLDAKYIVLEDKISQLQNSQNSSDIIISYFKLYNKIKKGEDYKDDLIITKLLINKNSKLYKYFLEFENLTKQKIKTHDKIIKDFDQIIGQIKSNNKIKDSDDVIDKIKNNILNQIVIRKINFEQEEPDNIDYIIHKIEINLKSKNYQNALNYIVKIKGESLLLSQIKINLTKLIRFQKINKKIIKLFG